MSRFTRIASLLLAVAVLAVPALRAQNADVPRTGTLPGVDNSALSREGESPSGEPRSDTVHVARPTGETEADRASVQAAFDAVQPGGTVLFAPGTYLLGAGVRLTVPDVTVLGHTDGTVLRGCDPEAFEVERADIGCVAFGCTGLYVQAQRQTIRDLTFEYTWHGIVVGPYPTTAEESEALQESGQFVPSAYPAGGQRIEGNTFRATPNGLRVLGSGEERSIVRDNDFVDVFHAIGIYGAPLHFVDNRVTVEDPGRVPSSRHPGSAILVSPGHTDCAGHVIAGNRVEGYPGAIYVLANRGESCRGVEIRDNTIEVRRVKVPEAWIGATPTEGDSTMVGVPITLTSLDRPLPSRPDVETEGVVEEIVIEGNRLLGAEGLGILVDGSRNRISRNTVTGIRRREPFPGVTWIGDEHVTWETANGSGIWVSSGSEHNEIVGNTFEDVAGAAVFLEGDRNRVELRSAGDSVRDLGTGTDVSVVDGAEGPDVALEERVAGEAGAVQPADRYEGPIIDMHLHAYTEDTYWGMGPDGAIPLGATGEPAPASAEEHRRRTLEVMEEYGVVLGAISGDELRAAEAFKERAPDRFLVGIGVSDPVADLDVEEFLGWVRDGRLEVFAEIGAQYGGYSPSDPAFEPYWSLAEAHGIPVGIHTGESFPGTPYSEGTPDFRLRFGDPLLLEDMLVAHPDLKVVVMHAGGWFYERTLQLMQMYPQVYAEIGVLGHAAEHRTTRTLERFLERAKAFGYLDRVMFGSDQMVWPEAIGVSVEAVQAIDFLTVEEKAAILYGNAARFLELSEEEVARHRGM